MIGQPEKALQTFRAALARGGWWAEFMLRSDSDLDSLQGIQGSSGKDPRYEMLVQIKEIFAKHNLPLMFEHFPEMAHQIPNDFETILQKGLKFILQEKE